MSAQIPPGAPGIDPRWTASGKIGVGTAPTADSAVWFTLSHGIINEVYFPRIDIANIRDLGLIVTDGKEFFSEEKRHAVHDYELLEDGIPAYRLTNTCAEGRYRITKTIVTDPRRHVLVQEIEFTPLVGTLADYHVYALLAPHVANSGYNNTCWAGDYKDFPMAFAQNGGLTLAFACSTPFSEMSCGYVGFSDGWQDLSVNKKLTAFYPRAENGNVAFTGKIDLVACQGKFRLALAFGLLPEECGLQAKASLLRYFSHIRDEYIAHWKCIQEQFSDLSKVDKQAGALFRMSTAVIKSHEGKHFTGSLIASLSIPWGFDRSDSELGGYHLIWPRDLVNTSLAFLAAGDFEGARKALMFLLCTQESDGHWAQCLWADGKPYWQGLQMDEIALPLLLIDRLQKIQHCQGLDPFPVVAKAASFIVKHGPVTHQDRWEEVSGLTPYTIATEIAALLAAADFFAEMNLSAEAAYLRETADWWYESLDRWLYVVGTPLAKKNGVEGYYVRATPASILDGIPDPNQYMVLKNKPLGEHLAIYSQIISVDALALVRYGLREANDPRILNTVKVIDSLLKVETSRGPIWHRYNEDGYGEHADGSPFDGTGIGRAWPLLNGERGHYELARGNRAQALDLCHSMVRFAGVGGLIPEQIWDAEDIPQKRLYKGHSTGAAKPLVWAHAEYITLLRSLQDGAVFVQPAQTVERYLKKKTRAKFAIWRPNFRLQQLPQGLKLRIQCSTPALVRFSLDHWATCEDYELQPLNLGIYFADLPTHKLKNQQSVIFTLYWLETENWEGKDYILGVV